jgi:putative membrane protein
MWVVRENRSWLRMLFMGGKSLPRIWERVGFATGLSILVTSLHETFPAHFPALTQVPFVLIGLPLGIFLGFRNTAAYDRFWEGRKLWGSLVNTSRTLGRQIMTVPLATVSLASKQEATRHVAAFAHALRTRLRDEPSADAERLLHEVVPRVGPWVEAGSSVPLFVLEGLARRFAQWRQEGLLSDVAWLPMEQSLVSLTDILGACERIKNTPIPSSYTVLMHRIVALYCVLLPLGIADVAQVMTPVVVFFVSYALFGLDAIGEEIEQPFGHDPNDLPLSRLCTVIETDLKNLAGQAAPT